MHSHIGVTTRRSKSVIANTTDMMGLCFPVIHGVLTHITLAPETRGDHLQVVPGPKVALSVGLTKLLAFWSRFHNSRNMSRWRRIIHKIDARHGTATFTP